MIGLYCGLCEAMCSHGKACDGFDSSSFVVAADTLDRRLSVSSLSPSI